MTQPQLSVIQNAAAIAATLHESSVRTRALIQRIVETYGEEQSRAWVEETLTIIRAGGTLTGDGIRQRTPGGIFFKLIKVQLEAANKYDELRELGLYMTKQPKIHVQSRPQQIPSVPLWADRETWIAEARSAIGKAGMIKVVLSGRPEKLVEKPGFTMFVLEASSNLGSVPKGIPVPLVVPATQYTVYVSEKHWRKVREAIKDPSDMLVVEGNQFYDPETALITIVAMQITTKNLKRQQKDEQASARGEQPLGE